MSDGLAAVLGNLVMLRARDTHVAVVPVAYEAVRKLLRYALADQRATVSTGRDCRVNEISLEPRKHRRFGRDTRCGCGERFGLGLCCGLAPNRRARPGLTGLTCCHRVSYSIALAPPSPTGLARRFARLGKETAETVKLRSDPARRLPRALAAWC